MSQPFRDRRSLVLAGMALLVVAGTALADMAVGIFQGANLANNSITVQTKKGVRQFFVGKNATIRIETKKATLKALTRVPGGMIAKVEHKGGRASSVNLSRPVPKGMPRQVVAPKQGVITPGGGTRPPGVPKKGA